MEFEFKGISYYIEKLPDESDNIFFNRCWFIIKHEPISIDEFNKLTTKSEIWSKHHFLKCVYNKKIQDELNYIDNNILYST